MKEAADMRLLMLTKLNELGGSTDGGTLHVALNATGAKEAEELRLVLRSAVEDGYLRLNHGSYTLLPRGRKALNASKAKGDDEGCEPEIASDRSTVRERIALTSTSLGETLDCLDDWRLEGDSTTPGPLPILQGWQPDDYERSLELMVDVLASRGRAVPDLIGIGSVCRRPVGGPSGVISVLSCLDRVLPPHVRLHLFGVKGAALRSMGALAGRVRSVDSMAWDFGARMARAGGTSSVEHRAQAMRSWLDAQVHESPQLSLF